MRTTAIDKEHLRERLQTRLNEIIDRHKSTEDTENMLDEPEIEPEETAQKLSIADVYGYLDEREKTELEAITHALSTIETGQYGFCEICGKPIDAERLEAIPWTNVCRTHANK